MANDIQVNIHSVRGQDSSATFQKFKISYTWDIYFEHEYTNLNSILVEKLPMFICRHINHLRSMAYKEPTRRAFWLKVSFHLMAMILSKLIINIDITLIVIKIRTITIIPTRIAMILYIDIIIISSSCIIIISTFILIAVIILTLYIVPTGLVQQYREG